MGKGYDRVSFFYDGLARLVFGDQQVKAQEFLLDGIPPNANILIVGGGTGWILESIAAKIPAGLHITYIDASERMIEKARRRKCGDNAVTFLAATIEDVSLPAGSFNVVITPFLFDNFTQSMSERVFAVLDRSLIANGVWLYTDFEQPKGTSHRWLLKLMYIIFRAMAGIKARSLPDMERLFSGAGFTKVAEQKFYKGFIISTAYKRA